MMANKKKEKEQNVKAFLLRHSSPNVSCMQGFIICSLNAIVAIDQLKMNIWTFTILVKCWLSQY